MSVRTGPDFPAPVAWQAPAESEDELDLLAYWRVLRERRTIVLAIFALTLLAGTVLTLFATPRYAASMTLKIERQAPDILTHQDVVVVDPLAYKDFYQTQYKLIRSRAVLRGAVDQLDLGHRPEYVARRGSALERLERWARARLGGAEADLTSTNRLLEFVEEELTVDPVRNSQLVRIQFLDRDAELARDIVRAVADAYQQFTLEARYTTTEQASEFLGKEVARTHAEIATLEQELQEYGSSRELVALAGGTQDITEQALSDLNGRLTEARGELARAAARSEALQAAAPDSMPEVLESPLIRNLRQTYADLEREHSLYARRFKPDWPARSALEAQLTRARRRLELEIMNVARQVLAVTETAHQRALAEVRNLEDQVEAQKGLVQRVNRDAIEYESLETEIGTRRQVLAELVARRSQTETSGQLRDAGASNIRVVDAAEIPERPARPRKLFNVLVSMTLGLFLGVATAFGLHYVDNTIKSESDIERYAPGVPVLGHLPMFEPSKTADNGLPRRAGCMWNIDLGCHTEPNASFAEAFRNLRTALLLASADQPPHRILVTSCEPSDGKSVVSMNLAIVLTQLGRRVLLVDADLRRPRIHRALRLPNERGLSTLLTGNAELDESIQDTPVPGLQVIPSGPIPPNPCELLGSPALEAFLDRIDQAGRFDHVIVDSPPTVQVADSLLLATQMHATILVSRSGVTPRESLIAAATRLGHERVRVAGVVLNAVAETSGYYYRRYGYYTSCEEDQPDGHDPGASANPSRRGWRRAGRRAS